MQTIYKYELGRKNNAVIPVNMLHGAIVLHVDFDPAVEKFCVWAIVDTEEEATEQRKFYIADTGKDLSRDLMGTEELLQINSFGFNDGMQFWFHGFEVVFAEPE